MMKINHKLKWLLMVLPLAGCATSIPLDIPQTKEVIVSSHVSTETKVKSVTKPPVAGVSEVKTIIEKKETEVRTSKVEAQPSINPLDRPGDLKALAQPKNVVSKPVNIDPNVKLIAPPVGLPAATNYAVPKVEEKENYVPRASVPTPALSAKATTCTKNKNGKKICKTSVKSEAKNKKENASVKSSKSSKSSSKTSVKSVSKKSTTDSKKPAAKINKKDTKH